VREDSDGLGICITAGIACKSAVFRCKRRTSENRGVPGSSPGLATRSAKSRLLAGFLVSGALLFEGSVPSPRSRVIQYSSRAGQNACTSAHPHASRRACAERCFAGRVLTNASPNRCAAGLIDLRRRRRRARTACGPAVLQLRVDDALGASCASRICQAVERGNRWSWRRARIARSMCCTASSSLISLVGAIPSPNVASVATKPG
jgi:hypothetical protein